MGNIWSAIILSYLDTVTIEQLAFGDIPDKIAQIYSKFDSEWADPADGAQSDGMTWDEFELGTSKAVDRALCTVSLAT